MHLRTVWVALLTVVFLAVAAAACGAARTMTAGAAVGPRISTPAGPTGATGAFGSSSSGPAVAAAQVAVDRFNATAGGPVTAQQSVLNGLVAAGQLTVQRACPPVTVTVSLAPVYSRLATAPGWHPSSGTLPGTVYAVPTLIRIYTGDRITGTDLTDLHLTIDGGRVTLPAICLR